MKKQLNVPFTLPKPVYDPAKQYIMCNADDETLGCDDVFGPTLYIEYEQKVEKEVEFPKLGRLPHYHTVWEDPECRYPNEIYFDGETKRGVLVCWFDDGGAPIFESAHTFLAKHAKETMLVLVLPDGTSNIVMPLPTPPRSALRSGPPVRKAPTEPPTQAR
jgi:hypothetical protein